MEIFIKITVFSGTISLDNPLVNLTVYEEDTVKMECELTGDPMPTYTWYKNNRNVEDIQQQDSRYDTSTILWGSRLVVFLVLIV